MRLLAVVDAPLERIDRIVERNAVLRHLFDGGWVTLVAPGADGTPWLRRRPDGRWVEDR
jgi:hypothetical protein